MTTTKTVDERFRIEITTEKGSGKAVTKTYAKDGRWATVKNNGKYSASGRSNAKLTTDNGKTTTFSHVSNAESAAMKYVNGGNWDYDPSYKR